jgi:hypothetical protein
MPFNTDAALTYSSPVGFMSKEWMKIGSDSTINDGHLAAQWSAQQGH